MHRLPLSDVLACRALRINSAPQYYRCEAAWFWAPPPLPDFDLWYVLDGEGTLRLDGTPHPVRAQTACLLTPGARVQGRHDPARRLRVFAVHFDLVNARGRALPPRTYALPPAVSRLRDGALFGALARACAAAWREGGTDGAKRAAGLLGQMLLELGAMAHAAAHPLDAWVGDLIETVREDPGRYWSVSDLARQAGLSRSQFARRTVAATGLAPERLLIQMRTERAKHLLRETDMSITAVADTLGYTDVFYFSRQFARVTGQTATAFRSGQGQTFSAAGLFGGAGGRACGGNQQGRKKRFLA